MKSREAWNLVIIGGIRAVIDLFTGPFLITYFSRISDNPTVSVSVYYILTYFFLGVGSILVARMLTRRFQMGMYRLGILFNIVYFLIFIFFGDSVIRYLVPVGILCGISWACYWYPIALIKTEKVTAEDRTAYFSMERVVGTLVSVLGPILLGSMITGSGYIETAVIVGAISVLQLGLTFLFKPMRVNSEARFCLKEAIHYFRSEPVLRQVFLTHFLSGFTAQGMALRTVSTLKLAGEGLDDLKIGYATSVSSILVILITLLYTRMFLRGKNTKKLMYLCGILPVLSFALAELSGNVFCYLVFFVLTMSLPNAMLTAHTIYLFAEVGEDGTACRYRGEYFSLLEMVMAISRIAGCLLLIPASLSSDNRAVTLVTTLLMLTLPAFSVCTIRYQSPFKRKQG